MGRDSAQVRALFDTLNERTARADIVGSNAGSYPDCATLEREEVLWDRVLDTNAKGHYRVYRETAKRMIDQGEGRNIIAISSGSGRSGRINASACGP